MPELPIPIIVASAGGRCRSIGLPTTGAGGTETDHPQDAGPGIPVDPDAYVSCDDAGDWLTCPACHQPTVMICPGDSVAGLLSAHAEHRCRR